ncbi:MULTISPECIES: hypothetical protein [unclassified Streptomyces]|uniref:hypothetical protein n=1 Tax=unclassified Streptomyces TaxID=2593676 RepID=UPI00068D8212|nr:MULTISPECIES: hypothetical protein [unclassified Streptomyces]
MKFTAEYKGQKFTRTSSRTYTHVVIIERDGEFIAARWSMSPEAAAKRLPHGWETERVATVEVTAESATEEPKAEESKANNEEGGRTVAAKKLKLKDVRGDVRIGAVPGADAIHALRNAVDAQGRNLPMCRTRTKNPIQYWGPAMEQKPELELCAGCSKVVPTGDVTVTEEPVKVPGLDDVTVTKTNITPVDADAAYNAAFDQARALGADHAEAADRAKEARDAFNKGENNMPAAAKKTAAAKPEPTQDIDALISAVHELADLTKSATDADAVQKFTDRAEEIIKTLPTKHRNTLRSTVSDAKKTRLAELKSESDDAAADAAAPAAAKKTASKAVAKRTAAAPAEAEDFNKFDGVPKLVEDGVKTFSEGMRLGMELTNAGEKLAHIMLDMRTRIPNPDANNLPDLMSARKTTKNSHSAVYDQVRKTIADDDVDRLAAFNSLQRSTQNKASDVLCEWLESFDGPDRDSSRSIMDELFPGATKKLDDNAKLREDLKAEGISEDAEDFPAELKPSEAIRELYADHGVTLPRYGRTELARYDRRVKAIESATKELETAKEADDAPKEKIEELENKVKELKSEVPADYLAEKLAPVKEKTDAERTKEALDAVKAQIEKAGKRFKKVTAANEKRKAKAEAYAIIRAAADAFDLDLSALVTSDEE